MKKDFPSSTQIDTSLLEGVFPPDDIRAIRALFRNSAHWAESLLPLSRVEATITPGAQQRIHVPPHWGITACAPGPHNMRVYLDPALPRWRDGDEDGQTRFSSVIVHEFHHCARRQGNVPDPSTLGDRMVFEGLAINFETETGHPDYLQSNAGDLLVLRDKAVPLLGTKWNDAWQFVTASGEIFPQGGEYDLGRAAMADFLKDKNLTASKAVHVVTKDVMDWWKSKGYALSCESPAQSPSPRIPQEPTGASITAPARR